MILAVDVGNTHTNLGLFEGDDLAASWTLSTRKQTTPDEVLVALAGVMSLRGHAAQDALAVDGAVLSCVVPDLAPVWRAVLARVSGERPLVVGPGLKTGLKMKYNDPGEIGSDRIADLVAAKERHGAPVVVVDLGTTTNFEVLDETGAFVGAHRRPRRPHLDRARLRDEGRRHWRRGRFTRRHLEAHRLHRFRPHARGPQPALPPQSGLTTHLALVFAP